VLELMLRLPQATVEKHRAALSALGLVAKLPPGFAPEAKSNRVPLDDGREVVVSRIGSK